MVIIKTTQIWGCKCLTWSLEVILRTGTELCDVSITHLHQVAGHNGWTDIKIISLTLFLACKLQPDSNCIFGVTFHQCRCWTVFRGLSLSCWLSQYLLDYNWTHWVGYSEILWEKSNNHVCILQSSLRVGGHQEIRVNTWRICWQINKLNRKLSSTGDNF